MGNETHHGWMVEGPDGDFTIERTLEVIPGGEFESSPKTLVELPDAYRLEESLGAARAMWARRIPCSDRRNLSLDEAADIFRSLVYGNSFGFREFMRGERLY